MNKLLDLTPVATTSEVHGLKKQLNIAANQQVQVPDATKFETGKFLTAVKQVEGELATDANSFFNDKYDATRGGIHDPQSSSKGPDGTFDGEISTELKNISSELKSAHNRIQGFINDLDRVDKQQKNSQNGTTTPTAKPAAEKQISKEAGEILDQAIKVAQDLVSSFLTHQREITSITSRMDSLIGPYTPQPAVDSQLTTAEQSTANQNLEKLRKSGVPDEVLSLAKLSPSFMKELGSKTDFNIDPKALNDRLNNGIATGDKTTNENLEAQRLAEAVYDHGRTSPEPKTFYNQSAGSGQDKFLQARLQGDAEKAYYMEQVREQVASADKDHRDIGLGSYSVIKDNADDDYRLVQSSTITRQASIDNMASLLNKATIGNLPFTERYNIDWDSFIKSLPSNGKP